jgi:hypothetical protein
LFNATTILLLISVPQLVHEDAADKMYDDCTDIKINMNGSNWYPIENISR